MSRDNINKFKILLVYVGVTLGTVLVFKYMLPVVAPFVVALLVAALIENPVGFLEKKLHLKRTFGAIIMIVLIFAVLFVGAYFGGKQLIRQVRNLTTNYEKIFAKFIRVADDCCCKIDSTFCLKGGTSFSYLSEQTEKTMKNITDGAVSSAMNHSANLLAGFTMLFTGVAITIMGTIFLSKDMEHIKSSVGKSVFGQEIKHLWYRLKEVLGTYFKTELIIMALTCGICTLGLFLLKNPYAFLLGVLIGLVDALPILGTGTVFIPWTIVLLLLKDVKKAVFIFLIYLVCYYSREFLEPKLMGNKLGVSPVMMLLAIYVGLKLFGILGVFTGPVALILIKELSAMIIKNL